MRDPRRRVEPRWKLLLQNIGVRRLLHPVAFRKVTTEPELVGRTGLLGLNVDDERRRQKWPAEDTIRLYAGERARHATTGDLRCEVIVDEFGILGARGMIREDVRFFEVGH